MEQVAKTFSGLANLALAIACCLALGCLARCATNSCCVEQSRASARIAQESIRSDLDNESLNRPSKSLS